MQSFTVSDVRTEERLLAAIAVDRAIAQRIAEPLDLRRLLESSGLCARAQPPALEAWACNHELVVAPGFDQPGHPLIEAVHTAFGEPGDRLI